MRPVPNRGCSLRRIPSARENFGFGCKPHAGDWAGSPLPGFSRFVCRRKARLGRISSPNGFFDFNLPTSLCGAAQCAGPQKHLLGKVTSPNSWEKPAVLHSRPIHFPACHLPAPGLHRLSKPPLHLVPTGAFSDSFGGTFVQPPSGAMNSVYWTVYPGKESDVLSPPRQPHARDQSVPRCGLARRTS